MMRLLFALLSLTSVVFSSNASFKGFYIGPQIGIDHVQGDCEILSSENNDFNKTGFQGGLTFGYMTEVGENTPAVFGAEIFGNISSTKRTKTKTYTIGVILGVPFEEKNSLSFKQKYNYGGALIAGIKINKFVPYLKLGYDFRKVESEWTVTYTGVNWLFHGDTNSLKSSKLIKSPLVGIGALYQVHPRIAIGGEYTYSILSDFKPFKDYKYNYEQNNQSLMVKTVFIF